MEGLMKKVTRKPLGNINTKEVRRRGCSVVKDSLHQFKRLSACSWDEFDMSATAENQIIETQKFKLQQNKFKINLYPSEGQPCSCVYNWEITLMKKVPGKTRKCKIVHKVRTKEIRAFTGRITVFEDKIAIWGTIKDGREEGDDFELTLTSPTSEKYYTERFLEGALMRGNRKKAETFEQTHDIIVLT